MNTAAFLAAAPCLEEIEGFTAEARRRGLLTEDDEAMISTRVAELMSGRVIPENSGLQRIWTYRPGKRPKRMTDIEIAVMNRDTERKRAMRAAEERAIKQAAAKSRRSPRR